LQVSRVRERAAGEALLDGGNQMRIAWFAHKQTSGTAMACEENFFSALAEQHDDDRLVERSMKASNDMNRAKVACHEARMID
jgi:hypothetical protein